MKQLKNSLCRPCVVIRSASAHNKETDPQLAREIANLKPRRIEFVTLEEETSEDENVFDMGIDPMALHYIVVSDFTNEHILLKRILEQFEALGVGINIIESFECKDHSKIIISRPIDEVRRVLI